MKVDVIEATDYADRVACRAARGDYFDGYYPDVSYEELMEGVETKERHRKHVTISEGVPSEEEMGETLLTEARTMALLQKTISKGHFGILEHPSITFSIKGVSRVVMAQITRHRHLSFDIQSMRYVNFDDVDVVVPPALLGETEFSREDGLVDMDNVESLEEAYREAVAKAVETYDNLVEQGVPKEAARYILPLGTPVNMTVSGNLRSFLHVLVLRDKADVQPETRELAEALAEELEQWAPFSCDAFEQARPFRPGP